MRPRAAFCWTCAAGKWTRSRCFVCPTRPVSHRTAPWRPTMQRSLRGVQEVRPCAEHCTICTALPAHERQRHDDRSSAASDPPARRRPASRWITCASTGVLAGLRALWLLFEFIARAALALFAFVSVCLFLNTRRLLMWAQATTLQARLVWQALRERRQERPWRPPMAWMEPLEGAHAWLHEAAEQLLQRCDGRHLLPWWLVGLWPAHGGDSDDEDDRSLSQRLWMGHWY